MNLSNVRGAAIFSRAMHLAFLTNIENFTTNSAMAETHRHTGPRNWTAKITVSVRELCACACAYGGARLS
jgi:hypothetical protein